jgi:hypothetical protein
MQSHKREDFPKPAHPILLKNARSSNFGGYQLIFKGSLDFLGEEKILKSRIRVI